MSDPDRAPSYLVTAAMRTTLFLVRHATPERDDAVIPYHVPPGPTLGDRGMSEARVVAEVLRPRDVTHILVSPMLRARQTADVLCEALGTSAEVLSDLTEKLPDESVDEVLARVQRALRIACRRGGTVAVVSHGAPIAAMLEVLGVPADQVQAVRIHDSKNPSPPAGIWEASWNGDRWQLREFFRP